MMAQDDYAEGYFYPGSNMSLRQKIALSMMRQRAFPKTFGEGLSAIGEAIGDIGQEKKLLEADKEARARAQRIASGLEGDTSTQTAQTTGGTDRQIPPMQSSDITMEGNVPIHEGGYNFMEAQVRDPRRTIPPTPGYMIDPLAAATNNPDEQALLGGLSGREAPGGAQSVSPTGASGPGQFTSGTGRAYGLVGGPQGDIRQDPIAAARAMVAYNRDNANAFRRQTGQEPTMNDLAVMYQQGAGGGMGLLQGRPVSPQNAVANRLPVGDAAAQLAQISRFYGMPNRPIDQTVQPPVQTAGVSAPVTMAGATPPMAQGLVPGRAGGVVAGGGPVATIGGGAATTGAVPFTSPRDQLAATLASTGQGVSQPNPTLAALPPQSAVPSGPSVSPPPVGGQQPISRAPPGQLVQASYEPPVSQAPTAPEPTQMSWREMQARRALAANPGDEYLTAALTPMIQREQQIREARDKIAMETYRLDYAKHLQREDTREKWLAGADERRQKDEEHTLKMAKERQALYGSQPDVMAGGGEGGNYDPRLGTSSSPQRSNFATIPQPPANADPQTWRQEQTKKAVEFGTAVDSAEKNFNDSIKIIEQARNHPGFAFGTGGTAGLASHLYGSQAYGFQQLMKQIQGKTFLAGYNALRGTGSISEAEGKKTEQAQAALDERQSEADLRKNLLNFEVSMREELERAQRRANRPVTAWRKMGDNTSFAPDIGERQMRKGRPQEYLGGNPYADTSWRDL